MQYKIVYEVASRARYINSLYNLQEKVNDHINGGWEPVGGVHCEDCLIMQAMIKRSVEQ